MTITIENKKHECSLLDDGSLDTVIEIDGIEHRYNGEFVFHYRNDDGSLKDEGFKELCKMAIDDDERHW